MADRSIKYNENLKCYVWKSGDIQNELAGREDGTTYTTEYNDFLRSCRPWNGNDVIFDLVWDEASAFFAGDKDALSVTRAIDNRVQLYLDEISGRFESIVLRRKAEDFSREEKNNETVRRR